MLLHSMLLRSGVVFMVVVDFFFNSRLEGGRVIRGIGGVRGEIMGRGGYHIRVIYFFYHQGVVHYIKYIRYRR